MSRVKTSIACEGAWLFRGWLRRTRPLLEKMDDVHLALLSAFNPWSAEQYSLEYIPINFNVFVNVRLLLVAFSFKYEISIEVYVNAIGNWFYAHMQNLA